MAQNNVSLPTTGTISGLTEQQDINNAFASFSSWFSGSSAPAASVYGGTIPAGARWLNTTNNGNVLNMYDGGAWIPLGTFDTTNNVFHPYEQGPVGTFRNLRGVFVTATTFKWTADEVIVAASLGGQKFTLGSYSQTLNISTTGAGGMDTGSASASADLSIYAIFNPATGVQSILGTLGSTSNGSVYSGAHMPSGYTASALIGSLKMNASAQFPTQTQMDRVVFTGPISVATGISVTSPANQSFATWVPANTRWLMGWMSSPTGAGNNIQIYTDATTAIITNTCGSGNGTQNVISMYRSPCTVAQNLAYDVTGGTNGAIALGSYEF